MEILQRQFNLLTAQGPLGLGIVAAGMIFLLIVTVMGKRWWLLAIYCLALMFSGFHIQSVNAASTLLRWLVVFLMAGTVMRGIKSPGLPALLIAALAIWGLIWAPATYFARLSVQMSGLLLVLSLPMAAAIADMINTLADLRKVMTVLLVAVGVYVLLGMGSLGSLRGGSRFSGAYDAAAPLFVLTGGLLLPVAGWGFFNLRRKALRVASGVCLMLIFALCVISGQRTGFFAGMIACLPLALGRFGFKKIGLAIVIVAGCLAVAYGLLNLFPAQKAFVMQRMFSLDSTGRQGLWESALDRILEAPLKVRGMGYSNTAHAPHNAFLCYWEDLGLVGLALFAAAMLVMVWQSLRLSFTGPTEELRDMGRLLLGWMLGSIAAGFYESKLNSPSNVAIFIAMLSSVLLVRARVVARQVRPAADGVAEASLEPGLQQDYDFGLLIQQYYG